MPRNDEAGAALVQSSGLRGRYTWFALAGFALAEFLALQGEHVLSYRTGVEADLLGLARLPVILPAAAVLIAALLIAPARLRLGIFGLGMAVAVLHHVLMQPETLFVDSQGIFDRSLIELLLVGLIVPPAVRRFVGPTPQFWQVVSVIRFALVAAIGLAICEGILVFAIHAQNPQVDPLTTWRVLWRGALLGAMIIVPTAVVFNEWRGNDYEGMNTRRWQELALLFVLLAGCRTFVSEADAPGAKPLVDVVFTLWALYRFPQIVPLVAALVLVLAESLTLARLPVGSADFPPLLSQQLIGIQSAMLASVIAVQLIAAGISKSKASVGLLAVSQERLRMALEAARDGIYEWNLLTGELSFEPTLGEVFGAGLDATPTNMSEVLPFMHSDDLPGWSKYRERLEDPGGTQEQEVRLRTQSGEVLWFRVRGAAVEFDDEGRASRTVGVFEDITDSKAARQALREREHQLRTMAALSSEGICQLAGSAPIPLDLPEDEIMRRLYEDFRVVDCNEIHARMYGYESPSQLVGMSLQGFIPSSQANLELGQRLIRCGFGVTEGEVRHIDRHGREMYCIINVTGVVVEGVLHSIWRFARDVTDRKQAELRMAEANRKLQQIIATAQEYDGIIGDSRQMQAVRESIERIATTDLTALILGETGTGKELVAQAIHSRSRRKGRPLVKLNCATLTPGLIESELFGHEKGAFTGAISSKPGRFELADGGTILLDEIGELSLELQAKLLRVLQEGEFERVGGTRTHRVDVRVIAATNRDLKTAVDSHSFRADLYYRLYVVPLVLPPLRERGDDIIALANHFLQATARKVGRSLTGFSSRSLYQLSKYPWPGNVRELQHVVERAAILSAGRVVEIEDLSPNTEPVDVIPLLSLADAEREHIRKVLELTGWMIEGPDGAATVLGLAPSTLRNRMTKLGLRRPKNFGAAASSGTTG